MSKLDGKVAIVTGAARGLGRAYAKRLAGLGAKVAVTDLNLRSYEEFEAEAKDMTADSTVAEIEAAGGTALGIEVDVRDHEAVEGMVARVVEQWGRVDVLVANAGGGRGRSVDTKASTLDPALLQLVTKAWRSSSTAVPSRTSMTRASCAGSIIRRPNASWPRSPAPSECWFSTTRSADASPAASTAPPGRRVSQSPASTTTIP